MRDLRKTAKDDLKKNIKKTGTAPQADADTKRSVERILIARRACILKN